MSISEPFIRRPIATSLLMLGMLVFGILAYTLLPVAALPNVDFPTITVTASYPGASPSTMASAIATPLEQQFTAIPSLDQMTSLSGTGTTTITLQFDLSRNIDGAAQDVQTAINAASGVLPKDLPSPPTYKKVNPANFPVLIYAVYSDALPVYRLDDYAYTVLAQQLSTVPGVSQVSVFGQKQYAARVEVNPGALAAHGIGLEDVRNALVAATVNGPKGAIEGRHQVTALDTNDQLFNASQYGNVIITYRNGAPVRVKDIGDAVNSVQNMYVGAWFNNQPAEGIAIERASGANTIELVNRIKQLMPHLEAIDPAIGARRADVRPLADHAGRGERRADHDGGDHRTGGAGHLHLPADRVGDRDPEHGGAAVAARHRRDHVRGGLQPRQHFADGADDLGGLRGGRCDRHDREHRALHRAGRAPVRTRRCAVPARSASPSFRSPFR